MSAKKLGDTSSIGKEMIRKGREAFEGAVVKENMLPMEVTHPLNALLIHSLNAPLTYPLTHPLNAPLIHPLNAPLPHPLLHTL